MDTVFTIAFNVPAWVLYAIMAALWISLVLRGVNMVLEWRLRRLRRRVW